MSMRSILAAASVATIAFAAPASATTYVYIGSWEVDQGPNWTTQPTAYSGVTAAALLFGGNAANYVTSTVDSNPADINFSAWVSTWGGACSGTYPCGTIVGDTSVVSDGGIYLTWGDTSAYVQDWATGSQYTNYAFSAVPETSTWVMMLAGFAGLGFAGYRRSQFANSVA